MNKQNNTIEKLCLEKDIFSRQKGSRFKARLGILNKRENYTDDLRTKRFNKIDFSGMNIIKYKNFEFHALDLSKIDYDESFEIIRECEEVERECWNAQEDFFEYASKCNFLFYVKDENRIAGFLLVSLHYIDDSCMFIIDECMVRKGYQGQKIAKRLGIFAFRIFSVWIAWPNRIKKFIAVSISCNPKVVSDYFRSWTARMLDNSFRPSEELIKIYLSYIETNSLLPVESGNPFVLKNTFPGSNRFKKDDPLYQFDERLKEWLPDEMDHYERGDAVAFLVRFSSKIFWIISTAFFCKYFGLQAFVNFHVGIMRKKCLRLHFIGPAEYDWYLSTRNLRKSF